MLSALRRLLYRLHFVIGSLAGIAAFLLISLLGILYGVTLRHRARDANLLFARSFGAVMRTALGWTIRVEGDEFVLGSAPALYMVNHQSNLDIVTYGSIFPHRTVVVGKKEILLIPLFGWFFKVTGNILLDRKNLESAVRSIDEAASRIQSEGISVWMFPEGHRNLAHTLLPFKKGGFHLAIAGQVPIVPIVSEPMEVILDAHRGLVRPGTFRVRVLKPIPTAGLGPQDVDALLEQVHAVMQQARDELTASSRAPIG
ncbi:MAG: lysophospholipid acyltransferase family protein [Thermoanaerobaculia bacterium]